MKLLGEQVEEVAASPTPPALLQLTSYGTSYALPSASIPSSSQSPPCNAEPPSSSSSPPPASQPPAASSSRHAVSPPPESSPPSPDTALPPPESPPPPQPPSASPPSPTSYPSARSASPPALSPLPSPTIVKPPTFYYRSPPPPPSPTIVKPPTFKYLSPPPPSPLHYAVPSSAPPSPAPFISPPLPPPQRTPPPPPQPSPPAVPSPAKGYSPPALPSAAPVRPNSPNSPSSSRNAKGLVVQRSSSGGTGVATGTVATIAVFSGLLMLSFVVAAVFFVKKRKKPFDDRGRGGVLLMTSPAGSANSQASDASNSRSRFSSYPVARQTSTSSSLPYSPSEPGLGNGKLWFTLDDLSVITNGFSTQNLLGEGGFGSVYKGCLQDGRQVAVKQLKMGAKQGEREFKAEVETISRVHHRHLVSLVGYCTSEDERVLVYDYVPNKTLYHHLHVTGTMDWATRVKVAAGAARGIAYLHEDCNPRIIHRDIKSSNILLDNNFEAKVSDFGLARSALDSNTHVTTRVMGTFGYLAPEYASSGKLTLKSDVYSFGVVLLELITGRKPVDTSQPLGDESLVEWARPSLIQALETRDFGNLPDPRLGNNYVEDEMFRMIEAAAACVRHSASMRPRMGQVVRAIDGLAEADITNGVRPGQSEIFRSSPESEEIRMFQWREFGNLDRSSEHTKNSRISRTDL